MLAAQCGWVGSIMVRSLPPRAAATCGWCFGSPTTDALHPAPTSETPRRAAACCSCGRGGGGAGPSALIGAPVPLWLQSVGVVAGAMLMVPVIITAFNFHGTLSAQGGWARAWNDTTLRFVSFGAVAFTAYGALQAYAAFRGPSALLRFTSFGVGLEHLLTYAFVTMVIFGAAYFILPRLTGSLWPSSKLVHVHFWGSALGILGSLTAWIFGGWQVGHLLASASVAQADVLRSESSWFFLLTVSSVLLLVGHVAFALNAFGMILKSSAPVSSGRHD